MERDTPQDVASDVLAPIREALDLDGDAGPAAIVAAINVLKGDTSTNESIAGGTYPGATWEGEDLVLALRRPIKSGDEVIESLRFREPVAADMIAMDQHKPEETTARVLALVAKITRRSPAELKRLSIRDFNRAAEVAGFFLDSGR